MPRKDSSPEEFSFDNDPASTNTESSSDLSYLDSTSGGEVMETEPATVQGTDAYVADGPVADRGPALNDANKIPMGKLVRLWTAIIFSIALMVLLIIFIAQNQDMVTIKFLTFQGELNLGLMLFIAALAGALIVAIVVAARVIKIRMSARKERRDQLKK